MHVDLNGAAESEQHSASWHEPRNEIQKCVATKMLFPK